MAKDHLMDNAEAESRKPLSTADANTDKEREKHIAWWRETRVGLFIHWGLYSLPAGVWKGEKIEAMRSTCS